MSRVVAVGGINLDTVARIDAAPTPFTSNPGRTLRNPGGVARNVAENLARLGVEVSLVGAVGQDVSGEMLLSDLARSGVDVTEVRRVAEPTDTYTAVLDAAGDLVIGVSDMTAVGTLRTEHLAPDLLQSADWLVLDANLPVETIAGLLDRAREAGVAVALDPVSVDKAGRLGDLDPMTVHTFTPNLDELRAFTGTAKLGDAVAIAHERGVSVVWLREGLAGSTLHQRGGAPEAVPAIPTRVVDVTGAGDAMLAGYLHQLCLGRPLARAAAFGAATACLTVAVTSAVRPDLSVELVQQTLSEGRVR
ncbi:MAG: carbohydrate kinase family protein [Actinomycetota bacterium]|nr:carbohydrate kinase family protein [Actinomycetota bacterium]